MTIQLDYANNEARLFHPDTQELSVRLRGEPADLVDVLDDLKAVWAGMFDYREYLVEDSVSHFGNRVRVAYADWRVQTVPQRSETPEREMPQQERETAKAVS